MQRVAVRLQPGQSDADGRKLVQKKEPSDRQRDSAQCCVLGRLHAVMWLAGGGSGLHGRGHMHRAAGQCLRLAAQGNLGPSSWPASTRVFNIQFYVSCACVCICLSLCVGVCMCVCVCV